MNNARITVALIVLLTVSAASAEDNNVLDDFIQSTHAAITLHAHAHRLAHELEYHYPFTNWARHQGSSMSHLAHQIEQDVSSGHVSRCRQKVQCLQKQLNHLELRMSRSIALHGRADGGHVRDRVKQIQELATLLDRLLQQTEARQERAFH